MEEFEEKIKNHSLKIAVIGMGYVGFPLASAFSKKFDVYGFDINKEKIEKYKRKEDPVGEFEKEIKKNNIYFVSNSEELIDIDVFFVTVPTPIYKNHLPNLENIEAAFKMIAKQINKKAIIVLESTVYPGVTEEYAIPILENEGLRMEKDFWIGYSPERINSADRQHTLENTSKIVSGINKQTTDIIAQIYETVISAPIYKSPNIKVAEAAKIIENTQRDINIAFMNELSIIFNKMEIDTKEVLKAASTKWNFNQYQPGLVGGHCIGVDPYYLAYKAEKMGIKPKMILAGREINDNMGKYIVETLIKKLIKNDIAIEKAKVGILGIAFKENCSDIRNSKVIDIIKELEEYQIHAKIYDPIVNSEEVKKTYGIELEKFEDMKELNAIILAVPHKEFIEQEEKIKFMFQKNVKNIVLDIKRVLDKEKYMKANYEYWGL